MQFQDYYQTLGVERGASREEIQRAYRKLARELHPDVNKASDAEQRFKAVTEAYEVLKDPEKRKRYDALGSNWRAGQEFTPPPGWEGARFDFGGAQGGDFQQFGDGFSSFFEAFFGGGGGPFGGGGFGGVRARRTQRPRRGATQEVEITLTLEDLVHGGTKEFVLESQTVAPDGTPSTSRRTYAVRIPPGTREGTTIRLAGQGGGGALGGPAGDLLLHVRLAPHPRFEVEGDDDLLVDVPLAPFEAALGAKVAVPLLDGEATLSVPAGSSSGARLRLRGQGLPRRDGRRGDLLAQVQIVVPHELGDEERELYERLAKLAKPQ